MTTKISPATLDGVQWSFDTVADMKAETRLRVGDTVFLRGHQSAGDGGAKNGAVVAAATGTDDNGHYHDLTASGFQFRADLGRIVNPFQFGAVGNGSTSDRTAIVNALAYLATLSVSPFFDSASDGEFPGQVVLEGAGGVFAVDQEVDLEADNSGILIRDMDVVAVAGTWETDGGNPVTISGATKANPCVITATSHGLSTGDTVLINDVVGMTELNGNEYQITYVDANSFSLDSTDSSAYTTYSSGGKARSMRQHYRPKKSDHIFKAKSNSTYTVFKNVRLNCNDLCGGVQLRARGRFKDGWIKKCAGVGVRAMAGDVWVSGSIIGQYDQNDAKFFDKDAFTGIGILCEDGESDMRVSNCVIRWLRECVRFDATNCNIWDCHIFNGAENYVNTDRSAFSAAMLAALDAHFGSGPTWDTYDFPARTYHAGIVTSGTSNLPSKDNSFSDIYFDNCHMEHYSDRVSYENVRIAAKLANTDPSRGAPDYWFMFYCNENGADPEFQVHVSQVLVETVTKEIVNMSAYGGNTWNVNYNLFEATRYNEGGSDGWVDGFRMSKPYVHVNMHTQTGFPAITYHGPQAGSFLGYSDKDTNLDSNGDPVAARVGGRGDNSVIQQLDDLIVEKREVDGSGDPTDVYTELFRVTGDKCLRLPALSAEPTGNNYDMAVSDGTSSTNSFGGAGAGLYIKLSGTWTKM